MWNLVAHFIFKFSLTLALNMVTPPVPFHSLPAVATSQHSSSLQTIIANLDRPTTAEFHSHTAHLSVNLVLFACSHPLVSKKFVIDQLGEYRKWCRSLCYKGPREMLIDIVPKGNTATFLQLLKQKSGEQNIEGMRVVCNFLTAREHISDYELGDYASILTLGHPMNNMLKVEFLYPNQDWEPPINSIPIVVTDKNWTFNPAISSYAVVETLRARQFRPQSTSTVSSPPASKVVVDQ